MARIAIIGAGLSGRLLALNLCRQAPSSVGILLIDRGDAHYMGPAYSDGAEYLLLNVPAGRMGAFPDDPEHFLKWARRLGVRAHQLDFLPRRLYRDYLIERAGLVVNCMGPETDYGRIDQTLVRNLMNRGLIRPGPANLGIDALPNGAVIGRDGAPSSVLYTIGSPMKGVLWEVLAVPDIRVQAQRLARLFLGA